MKKQYLKILFLLAIAGFAKSQCSITIACSSTTGCAPFAVSFNCPQVNNGTATWNFGTSSLSGLAVNMVYANAGLYTLTLTLVAPQGAGSCTATATTSINVVTGPENGCTTTVVGLNEEFIESRLLIYPNPNSGRFEIQLTGEIKHAEMILYNALGQKVLEEKLNNSNTIIDASLLSKGVYSLCLFENGKRLGSKKLVIE